MMPFMTLLFLGSVIVFLAVLAAIVWFLTRIGGGGNRQAQAEETRLMQELHEGLEKMEERIEALETILLETRNRKGERP